MPKFKLNKLVRDKIVEDQIAAGGKPTYRLLTDEEHKQALVTKIIEETKELSKASEAAIADEIADVLQVVHDLIDKHGLSNSDIITAMEIKRDKKGSFKKGVFVESLELEENNPWVAYYRSEPDRFPEIK
jgi:predicted house-cleaning noncanonical NTP pyrophosphatase (MazG superfamily)